jgi:aryl-alcohol dehydrogenase-like predicted oxidoreductase
MGLTGVYGRPLDKQEMIGLIHAAVDLGLTFFRYGRSLRAKAVDRPDPGTTKLERLKENLGAVEVELDAEDLERIDAAAAQLKLEGARLPDAALKMTGR